MRSWRLNMLRFHEKACATGYCERMWCTHAMHNAQPQSKGFVAALATECTNNWCCQSITPGLPGLCASYKISLMLSQPPTPERIQQTLSNKQCKEKCTLEERFAKCNGRHVPRERIRTVRTRVRPRHAQRHSMSCK